MFCTNCGKNINDEGVCPFCGTTQELYNIQNPVASSVNQAVPQQKFIQNQFAASEENAMPENLKFGAVEEDKHFNVISLIFSFFWLIYNKMWQAVILNIVLLLLAYMLGNLLFVVYVKLIWNIFWGARGNYYKRLLKNEKINFINAIQKRLY